MQVEPLFWTVWEASVVFAVSEKSIRRMVHDGLIDSIRVGGAIRIPRSAVPRARPRPPKGAGC